MLCCLLDAVVKKGPYHSQSKANYDGSAALLGIGGSVREGHHHLDYLGRWPVLLGVIWHGQEGGVSEMLRRTGRDKREDSLCQLVWLQLSHCQLNTALCM